MIQLYHILKYKFIANSRLSLKLSVSDIVKEFGSFIVYGGFAVGAFFVSKVSLFMLIEKLRIGLFLLHEFISIIFFIFFLSINVGNIIVSWSTLYKSEEINYYFTKPIATYKLFLIKFIDNIFYSSSTLLLVLLSVFFGYISYFQLSIIDLLIILIFNLLPFILTAASLGVIVLLIVVKLAVVIGARKLIITIALIYLSSLIVFFKILSPVTLVYDVLANYPDVDQYFGYLIPAISHYMPNQWFSDSLYWMLKGNESQMFINVLKQISTAFFFFCLAIILGNKWYYNTWLKNIRLNISSEKKSVTRRIISENMLSEAGQTFSLILKDFIVFFRDSTQLVHALILLLLMIIFMISSSGISYLNFEDIKLAGTIYMSIFMFIILLISTLALRFIFPLISLEGKVFWKIRSAPVNYFSLINIKIVPFTIILLGISILLAFFSHIKLAPHLTFYAVPVIISIALFLIMMNYCMGIIFVKFNEKNAIRIASSKGASLSFLFGIIYMIVVIVIMFPSVQEHFSVALNSNYYMYRYIKISYYIVTVISMLGSLIFFILSHYLIRRDY